MKPICEKGNQKRERLQHLTSLTPENLHQRPPICISWTATEDHVMVAALVESVERLWFNDFFHEGKINAGYFSVFKH